jgi:hypothetical protein
VATAARTSMGILLARQLARQRTGPLRTAKRD